MNNLKLFLQVYLRPGRAVSDLMDKGKWPLAVALMLIVSAGFFFTVNTKLNTHYQLPAISDFYPADVAVQDLSDAERQAAVSAYDSAMERHNLVPVVGDAFFNYSSFDPLGFYRPLLTILIFYIPLIVYLISIFGNINDYGHTLRREFATLATCTLSAWAASHLPFIVFRFIDFQDPAMYLVPWIGSSILFGSFMVFVLRTVFGLSFRTATGLVLVASIAFCIANLIYQYVPAWAFLPFSAVYLFYQISQRFGSKFDDYRKSILPGQNY